MLYSGNSAVYTLPSPSQPQPGKISLVLLSTGEIQIVNTTTSQEIWKGHLSSVSSVSPVQIQPVPSNSTPTEGSGQPEIQPVPSNPTEGGSAGGGGYRRGGRGNRLPPSIEV